jgi:hypothetical protein
VEAEEDPAETGWEEARAAKIIAISKIKVVTDVLPSFLFTFLVTPQPFAGGQMVHQDHVEINNLVRISYAVSSNIKLI